MLCSPSVIFCTWWQNDSLICTAYTLYPMLGISHAASHACIRILHSYGSCPFSEECFRIVSFLFERLFFVCGLTECVHFFAQHRFYLNVDSTARQMSKHLFRVSDDSCSSRFLITLSRMPHAILSRIIFQTTEVT